MKLPKWVDKDRLVTFGIVMGLLVVGSTLLGIEFGWKVGLGIGCLNYSMLMGYRLIVRGR